jgi:hypothetical protein
MARKTSRQRSKPKQSKPAEAETSPPLDAKAKPKISFWRRVLKALPLMILALLLTFVFSRTEAIKEWETISLDTQMRLDMPAKESDVVIVDITQQDFERVFEGKTRPLNPDALQRVIAAIAKGRPCVVGVDIDTSFKEFKDFKVDELSNVVWEREAEETPENVNQKPVPLDVLGGQNSALNTKSGLPLLIDDAKQVPRLYTRLIKTTRGDLPSFAWAVFKEGKSKNCVGLSFPDLKETTEPMIIGYSRGKEGAGRTRIFASDILKYSEDPNWPNSNPIKDKIVLLGGSYLGEDKSETPLGVMSGVEITANVIETELRGGGTKPPGFLSIILLQIFDGVLLITLFQIFSWRKAALLSLPLIIFLSLACSFLTYYSFSHWAFFVPVMIGVALTLVFDEAKEHFKKRYRREITETYQEFSGQPPGKKQDPPAEE